MVECQMEQIVEEFQSLQETDNPTDDAPGIDDQNYTFDELDELDAAADLDDDRRNDDENIPAIPPSSVPNEDNPDPFQPPSEAFTLT